MTNLAIEIKPENVYDPFYDVLEDCIDNLENDPNMDSLDDITAKLFEKRAELMGHLAKAVLESKFEDLLKQEYHNCPCCRKRLKVHTRNVPREILSLIGPIGLRRHYFYCKDCKHGFYPFDEAVGLADGKMQPDVKGLEAWLASEETFERASETFRRSTGIDISAHHMHEAANDIAGELDILDVAPTKEQVERHVSELSRGKFRRPILMLGIDGAHAPVRPEPSARAEKRGPGEWKEVKGFRLYLIGEKRIVHLVSWHQIGSDRQLFKDLEKIKSAGLIPEDKVRLCVVADGASWIWNRTRELFPGAKLVLDYYHCSERLHSLSAAQFGKKSQEGRQWVESILAKLFHNFVEDALDDIGNLEADSDEVEEEKEKTFRYLEKRKDKIKYGATRRGGYNIGSGAIESSNKFISNIRLKKSGAWWYPSHANNILKLRCAIYNGTFDKVMDKYKNKFGKEKAKGDAVPKIKLVVDNC